MIVVARGFYAIIPNVENGPDVIEIGKGINISAFPFKKVGYDGVSGDLHIVADCYAASDGKIKSVLKYYIK